MKKLCFVLLMFAATPAWAYDCTIPAAPCKVITVAPDEEQALLGPGMILDTAERGKYVDLSSAVKYFRDKLKDAPAGEPVKPKEVSNALDKLPRPQAEPPKPAEK